MGNGDIDFMQNADGVAFDAMGEGLVVTSPFSDDAAEVKNWKEKAEEVDAPETSEEITGDELADYFMAEFLKGDGDGDGDDEPSLGRGVTLDLDMAKHMDRYHPEGITEKSTCKYIGNREGENDTPVDYYEKKGNIPTKDAFEWFSERYNISCYQPKTADDIKDLCLSSKRTEKLLKGRPLSKSEFDNTVLFLYRVCEDIKSRFPEVKFGIDFIYFWDDAPTNSGGTCTLDRREGIGYMFIGGSEALHKRQSLNYYHEDDRMLYDVIRHELGHSLSSSKIKREFNTLFSNERIEEYGRTKLAYDLATKVSLAAAEFLYIEGDRDKDIAKEECIAELFSVYTSPWYTKGTLPFGAEKFVEAMIKGEGLPMQIDMLQKTEDGFPNKGGKERRPEWIRGMEVIDPMPMRDYSKPFYTWDDYNEEWKYFNTTDERDRYNAWLEEKASRVSAEDKKIWIEEMCRCMKKKCNAQWQSMSNTAMDSVDKPNIFDPERFDQNSFEWGAIYWINQIRDAVEGFEDEYVVPDEQFVEMLRPLYKAAKVYAEAHGKDKAWVKNTVLSVPKAFANAFDTLSDGEGVSKEHFLKVMTVEGICALAEGDIDSVHELENYYYRKGQYSPKGGYEVGRYVVIVKDPPSKDNERDRIRHIIAIRGEKNDDDPMLVFWNTSKSGIVERKASQCSKPFKKCDEAYDWWFVENGDGARKVKNNPKAEEEERGEEIYKAILASMGITEDADPDMADADFWAKHDKARHGGHFDQETMTCKLREKYEQGEKIENLKDEMDDIEGEDPDVGASVDIASRQDGDLNSDHDYGIISEVLKAEKDRKNGRPAQFHQRVPEEALRGGDEGTRILREAALVCRATEGTGSQGEGNSGGGDGRGEGAAEGAVSGVEQAREASRRQEAILEKYAKKFGIWEDDAATELKERDDYDYIEGGETIAFFPDDKSKPLTKVITSAYFPETVQLLDRIMLHNYLFPYSKLDVKGFGRARPDWLTDGDPMFCVKVEQQPVDTSCPAKPEQIEEYMKNLGFHKHRELAGGDVVWESNDGKYVVSDLTDENVFLTQDGNIAVIDANIQLNTPDSDGSGRYMVPPYREVSVGNGKKFTAKKNELVDKVSGRGMDGEDFFKGLIALAGGDGTVKKMEYAARRMTSQHPVAKLVSGQEFFNIISKAKDSRPDKDKWRVDVHEASDYEKDKCFATDGGSVFAIAGEDIISVCKNPDDRTCSGAMLIEQAVKEGGRKLDSYEGNHAFYAKCGFEPVSWTKFNPEYAAPGTPPEDVIFYIYTGNKRKMTVDESHDELEKFKASVAAKDYDEAGKIRDEILMSRG